MQALILAGGEGTRLRPLTSTVPKPVVPLVDRPFIAYMLEWLGRHGVDDVILSCGFMADGVRGVLGDGERFGDPAALPRGAAAARHRRRAEVRRGAARRAVLHAQRRRAHRHRPDRPARAARAHRRPGDARADRGRGSVALRPRPPARGRLGEGVPREAGPRADRHQPDQRRRLHPRARRARRDGAGGHEHLDRARRVPGARRPRAVRLPVRTATGSTSAPPSATCRRPSTSSRATSTPRSDGGWARPGWRWPRAGGSTGAWSRRRWPARARVVAAEAIVGGRAVLGPA